MWWNPILVTIGTFGVGKLPKARGRHRGRELNLVIWLQDSVYSLWKEKKGYTGFVKNTNYSEFAEFLLHRTIVLGYLQRSSCDDWKFKEATWSKFQHIATLYKWQASSLPSACSLYLFRLSGCILSVRIKWLVTMGLYAAMP